MEQIKFCLLLRCKFFMTHLSCKEEEFVVRSYCVDYSDDWASWIFLKNTLIIEAKKKKKQPGPLCLPHFQFTIVKTIVLRVFFYLSPPTHTCCIDWKHIKQNEPLLKQKGISVRLMGMMVWFQLDTVLKVRLHCYSVALGQVDTHSGYFTVDSRLCE